MTQIFILFIIGTAIGSFLNVCIYRLPEKRSLIFPRSFCPVCKKNIPFWANIPIVGYLFLRGKCFTCSTKISLRYPLVELLAGILTVLSFMQFGITVSFFIYSIFIYFLIIIAFIDIKTHLIYNKVLILFLMTGIITQIFFPFISWEQAILGSLAGGFSLFFISLLGKLMFKKESMGMGDIKLAAVTGFFIGWKSILIATYLGFIVAFITMTIVSRMKKRP